MLAILKLFVLSLIVILAISAVLGVVAFFMDLHAFKSEKDLSLPRKRLIETLFEEQELKNKLLNSHRTRHRATSKSLRKWGGKCVI